MTSRLSTERSVIVVLALALVAALVAVVVLATGGDDGTTGAAARTSTTPTAAAGASTAEADAEAEARAAVVRMTTYDHTTVDSDFDWVKDAGTAQFQTYFAGASEDAIAVIKQLGADATGTVVDSAATAVDDTHVKVLLFVDQEITARGSAKPKIDQPRVSMSMVLEDGTWLVDEVAINNLLSQ